MPVGQGSDCLFTYANYDTASNGIAGISDTEAFRHWCLYLCEHFGY